MLPRIMNFGRIRIPNIIRIFKNDEYEFEYYSEFEKLFKYYLNSSFLKIRILFGIRIRQKFIIRGNTDMQRVLAQQPVSGVANQFTGINDYSINTFIKDEFFLH